MSELKHEDILPNPNEIIRVAGLEMSRSEYDLPDILEKMDQSIRDGLREIDRHPARFYGDSSKMRHAGGGVLTAARIEQHGASDELTRPQREQGER